MSNNGIPVLKFLFKDDLKALKEALVLSPAFEVEEFSGANDLSTYLANIPAGLVIASLRDKNDLIQIASFVKIQKKAAKDTVVKIVVVNFCGDRNFERAISKLGIQDLIEPGINTKALKFKLDFWMKALSVQVRNSAAQTATQKTLKGSDPTKPQEKKLDTSSPLWQDALEIEDDIWILKNESEHCKKVLNKWLIRFMGPSPYVGQWTEVKPRIWRFDIKPSEKELYVPNEGAWFFTGDQKPDFIWKENLWLMTGDNFELIFKSGDVISTRAKSKDRVLTICKNSIFAKTKEPVIIESFDKELVFKKEAENLENLEGENKTDKLNYSNLEGKNKTDKLNGGNLEGKNKTPADRSGHLSGKTKGEGSIDYDDLDMDASNSKEKTHWSGKNMYEQPQESGQEGAKKGPLKEGRELGLDADNQDVEKYYKNGLNAQAAKERPKKEWEDYQENAPQDNYGGKSETDRLNAHYGSKQKEKSPGTRSDDPFSGESSTDKFNGHYGKPSQGAVEAKKSSDLEASENNYSSGAKKASIPQSASSSSPQEGKKSSAGRGAADWYPAPAAESEKSSDTEASLDFNYGERKTRKVNSAEEASGEFQPQRLEKNKSGQFNDLNSPQSKDAISKLLDSDTYADVLPMDKLRQEKAARSVEDKSIDELTTEAKVMCYMTQNARRVACKLDDFFEEQIIFLTEEQNIPAGVVKLDMVFSFMKKDTSLKIDAEVVSVDGDGDGNNYITVNISKENVTSLNAFMKLFQAKQQNVTEFLKRVKGL